MTLSRTQRIAFVANLAAISVLLDLIFDIPAPYAPFLKYEFWEIPIVVAFIAAGFGTGLVVGVINVLVLEFTKPGIPSGPWFNFAALLSMVAGIYIAEKVLRHEGIKASNVALFTAFGALARVAVMTFVNLVLLPLPYPVGFSLPLQAVVALLPLIGLFNLTLSLYTIPIAYIVVKGIATYTRFPLRKVNITHA